MKTRAKKLPLSILTILSLLAFWSFSANACDPNFHLQVVNTSSLVPYHDVCVRDDNENCLFSTATLSPSQSVEGDLAVTSGQHLIFTAYDGDNQLVSLDLYPLEQQAKIDIVYENPLSYSEWGGPIVPPPTYTISTSSSPAAGGTTSVSGTVCNSSVTVTATGFSCYTFVNWTEGTNVVSTSSSYMFTATEDRTLVANFAPIESYTISTSSSPTGGGTTSGGGTKSCGSTVTLTATPASGYAFVNWKEGSLVRSTSTNYTFTANANRTFVANFIRQYTITTSNSPSNGGTTSGGGIKNDGSSVTVTATPNSGYAFVNWTEGWTEVGIWPSYTFTVNANRALVANFLPAAPTAVSVSATLADAWESSEAPGVFTITRVSTNIAFPLPVSVQVSGTASNAVDYTPINSQVTIPAGANSVKVYVWPFQDNITEDTESVVLTLNSASSYTNVGPASATVSIYDDCASPLADPRAPGSYALATYQYGPSGGRIAPSPNFTTSSVGDPISGYLFVPNGSGPFPLVVMLHGCGYYMEGLRYLCSSLASNGIIATTVNPNTISSDPSPLLATIGQFATWNDTVGHPLYGRVDTNHIMLVGHSCGGRSVALAATNYNGAVAGNPIKAIVGLDAAGLLPIPINNTLDNYLNLTATHDGSDDRRDNPAYNDWISYDITNQPAADAPGFRAQTWIYGAFHANFLDDASASPPSGGAISLEDQLNVVKIYVGAMAQAVLLGHPEYLKFLQDYRFAASVLPPAALCPSEYQPPVRSFINHFDLHTNNWWMPLSPYDLSATNIWNVANPTDGGIIRPEVNNSLGRFFGWFHWSDWSHYFQVLFSGQGLDASGYSHIALRIGQKPTSLTGVTEHLKIIVQDTSGNSASFGFALPYPLPQTPLYPTVQTVRIPLPGLSVVGVDVHHVAFIRLAPEAPPLGSSTGSVVFDDIQLYNAPLSTPTITAQPASQRVNDGSSVTFTVVASGSGPLSYQWKFNGVNISGATSSSYTIPSAGGSGAGNYTVVVSNPCGSTTSATAVLTVACTGTLHLLLGNDTGWTIENIHVWKHGGGDLLSAGETLQGGEGKWFDLTVTPGDLYHFYGDSEGGSIQFTSDFYPQEQDGLIDIMYPTPYYYEWGGSICGY